MSSRRESCVWHPMPESVRRSSLSTRQQALSMRRASMMGSSMAGDADNAFGATSLNQMDAPPSGFKTQRAVLDSMYSLPASIMYIKEEEERGRSALPYGEPGNASATLANASATVEYVAPPSTSPTKKQKKQHKKDQEKEKEHKRREQKQLEKRQRKEKIEQQERERAEKLEREQQQLEQQQEEQLERQREAERQYRQQQFRQPYHEQQEQQVEAISTSRSAATSSRRRGAGAAEMREELRKIKHVLHFRGEHWANIVQQREKVKEALLKDLKRIDRLDESDVSHIKFMPGEMLQVTFVMCQTRSNRAVLHRKFKEAAFTAMSNLYSMGEASQQKNQRRHR